MYYAQGYTGNHRCTIMSVPDVGKACRYIEYFSSTKLANKIRIGKPDQDNTRWIKNNRFILESIGKNDTQNCERQVDWGVDPDVVDCLTSHPLVDFIHHCDWKKIGTND